MSSHIRTIIAAGSGMFFGRLFHRVQGYKVQGFFFLAGCRGDEMVQKGVIFVSKHVQNEEIKVDKDGLSMLPRKAGILQKNLQRRRGQRRFSLQEKS